MSVHDNEKGIPSTGTVSGGHDHHAHRIVGKDQDIATELVGEQSQEIDPALEARVVRKIDWFLIPVMIFGYGLVYYDKV